jgi:thiamine pyrophosphokinase
MKNKIAIIANGNIHDIDFHKKILENINILICADGGSNTAKKMNITPDYIIGDLDSVDPLVIDFFKNQTRTKIIHNDDQDKTDLELALNLAESLDPNEILILGAIGDRMDHTLANILCLTYIKSDVKAKIIDEKNTLELVEKSMELSGNRDDIVSIVPITDILGLTYSGMKWLVVNKDTKFGWFGISNKISEKVANISLTEGKILVIHVRE